MASDPAHPRPIQRNDLTHKLVHFTKSSEQISGWKVLLKILEDKRLIAGKPDREGSVRYICFSEAPLAHMGRLLGSHSVPSVLYEPYGIMVDKRWLFEHGGRPVIYQSPDEYAALPEGLQYRHKKYDPTATPPIDFTWEREWRLPANELELDAESVTVVLPTRRHVRAILEPHEHKVNRSGLATMGFGINSKAPWHFVSLDDLGIEINPRQAVRDLIS